MRFLGLLIITFIAPITQANSLLIGTVHFKPPFVINADNKHVIGFDIDIMTAICKHIPIKCQFKTMPFGELFYELDVGNIDLAIADITITPKREEEFLFSLPYLPSSAQFIAKKKTIQTLPDLIGKRIGVENALLFTPLVLHELGDQVTIKPYTFIGQMVSDLSNGLLDAVILDTAIAETWFANSNETFHLVGPAFPLGLGYGIMATKNNGDLIADINNALLLMQKDGSYMAIYNTYFSN